jgi:acyl dehydratase
VTFPSGGETATVTRTITQDEIDRFAALTGDDNPIHVDPIYARTTRFGATVAHGMHLYALVRAAITTRWPDAVDVGQELIFPAPTTAGSQIMIRLEVEEADDGEARVAAVITSADGTDVTRGVTCLEQRGSATARQPERPETPATGEPTASRDPPPEATSWWTGAVGRRAKETCAFDADEVSEYEALTGDRTAGRDGAVPWPLAAGAVSLLLGTRLPGRGTNWLKQSLVFAGTVPIGDPVTVAVEITRVRPEKGLVDLAASLVLADGSTVASGRSLVLARPEEKESP